jgi:predicted amidophosphoribosyltransferase
MTELLAALADLVLPRRCAGCDTPGATLCAMCSPPRAPVEIRGVQIRGAPVPAMFAAHEYRDGVRAALLAYKERNRRELAGPLGALLARAAAQAQLRSRVEGSATTVLVPVPSARAIARRRGGDHVLRLAIGAGRLTGLQVLPVIRLARAVRDSSGLDVAQRAVNLHHAMSAMSAMRAMPTRAVVTALIVDDIVTTGTTIAEAARSLEAAGWSVSGAAAVAATPLRHHAGPP